MIINLKTYFGRRIPPLGYCYVKNSEESEREKKINKCRNVSAYVYSSARSLYQKNTTEESSEGFFHDEINGCVSVSHLDWLVISHS